MDVYDYQKKASESIVGSVIDIETIGDIGSGQDRYKNTKQVILGYIASDNLRILCALNEEGIAELSKMSKEIIVNLPRPLYAFNCSFEQGVWFHHIGIRIDFDGELQGSQYESKKTACQSLRIPNYGDPFDGDGKKCIDAWLNGDFKHCIAHNRACLLKERDILIKRGATPPAEVLWTL